jgi:hypothetical protein
MILASSLSSSETVTVGGGGSGGVTGDVNGFDGTASSFGTHVVCGPGCGANQSGSVAGGLGGSATGGDFNLAGGQGGAGGYQGGAGGVSFYGGNGFGATAQLGQVGSAVPNSGSGGGGWGSGSGNGGSGGTGMVTIWMYT